MTFTLDNVLAVLAGIEDPRTGRDIIRMDRVKSLEVGLNAVKFTLVHASPGAARRLQQAAAEALRGAFGEGLTVDIATEAQMIPLGDSLEISGGGAPGKPAGVRNYVAVASGKGGVGKSTVAVNLALALAGMGYDVGIVDADIYGPSMPTMLGLHNVRPTVNAERKIVPLEKFGVKVLSIGFMIDPAQATIWRGPMVSSAIRQFLGDAAWGELDYLILDLPPGTGDIQLTIVQTIPLTGAVIVSTPQDVALADARKGVGMFRNVQVPVLGVVENMAYFAPPDLPDRRYYLFGRGGARRLAEELSAPFLGELPIEEIVREGGDDGRPVVAAAPETVSARAFRSIAEEVARQIRRRNAQLPPTQPVEILHR